MKKPLQIEGARALVDAGAIAKVRVIASHEGLFVELNDIFTISTRLKETRFFAKSDTCFSWLRELGITHINEVDLTDWA